MAELTVPIQMDIEHAKEIYQEGYQKGKIAGADEFALALMDILDRKRRDSQLPVIHPSEIMEVAKTYKQNVE